MGWVSHFTTLPSRVARRPLAGTRCRGTVFVSRRTCIRPMSTVIGVRGTTLAAIMSCHNAYGILQPTNTTHNSSTPAASNAFRRRRPLSPDGPVMQWRTHTQRSPIMHPLPVEGPRTRRTALACMPVGVKFSLALTWFGHQNVVAIMGAKWDAGPCDKLV
jgi:hypothetical protein